MTKTNLLLIFLPIIAGLISSYFTYYLTMKSKKIETMLKFKEEKYANLLVLLQGFVGVTVSGVTKRNFFEEQYKSWLYCSDEVVKAINEMVHLLETERGGKPDANKGREVVGSIVLAMRRDLFGKTRLKYDDFRYMDVIE